MASPTVSVIIVTFNSGPALQQSLPALKQSTIIDQLELIVIDNNSTDDTLATVNSSFPSAQVIQNGYNAGFAKACNQGADIAGGRFLLFFNPDLIIDNNAIELIVSTYDSVERPGALSGRMRFPDGAFQPTCRKLPTMSNIFASRGSFLGKLFNQEGYTLPDYSDITEVEAAAGTFLLVLKESFEKLGRFDERFFMYMEDTDYSYRIKQAGLKVYSVPAAGGVHWWGKGSSGGRIIRSYYHHRSVWKYFIKHFPNYKTFLMLPLLLAANFVMRLLFSKR